MTNVKVRADIFEFEILTVFFPFFPKTSHVGLHGLEISYLSDVKSIADLKLILIFKYKTCFCENAKEMYTLNAYIMNYSIDFNSVL